MTTLAAAAHGARSAELVRILGRMPAYARLGDAVMGDPRIPARRKVGLDQAIVNLGLRRDGAPSLGERLVLEASVRLMRRALRGVDSSAGDDILTRVGLDRATLDADVDPRIGVLGADGVAELAWGAR